MKKTFTLLTVFLLCFEMFPQYWMDRPIAEIWDTLSFEKPYEYLTIDSSAQNIWQIGQPQKTVFQNAYQGTKAIITDTIHTYPINNRSYCDLKIGYFNYDYYFPYNVFIEIKHKYDTDTLKDGGYITVSFDNGLTWKNVIEEGVMPFFYSNDIWNEYNLYTSQDILYDHEYGFSGNSNGWETTYLAWYDLPTSMKSNKFYYSDTIIIRFNFMSDDIDTGKDGWMIDNIKLFSVDLGDPIMHPDKDDVVISPNPVKNQMLVDIGNIYNSIQFEILDLQGKRLLAGEKYKSPKFKINLAMLKSGMYFLCLNLDGTHKHVKKIIVQ